MLSIDKRQTDKYQDIQIKSLYQTVESLSEKVSQLKNIKGVDGKTPVKGVDYFDGKDGRDGKDGVNGTNGLNGTAGINGADGAQGQKGEPANELDIECKNNKIMKKYSGDSYWQSTNIKCESTNV